MNIERYAQSTELGQEVPKGSAGTRAACVDSVSAAITGRSVLMFCGIPLRYLKSSPGVHCWRDGFGIAFVHNPEWLHKNAASAPASIS